MEDYTIKTRTLQEDDKIRFGIFVSHSSDDADLSDKLKTEISGSKD